MTYSIQINGHKATESTEESQEFELAAVEETRKLVSALDGVTHAKVTGGTIGTVDLLEGGENG